MNGKRLWIGLGNNDSRIKPLSRESEVGTFKVVGWSGWHVDFNINGSKSPLTSWKFPQR